MPLRREQWGFFDRQRSLFSSLFKDMDDEFKEFDRELEKMRKEMFTLKVSGWLDGVVGRGEWECGWVFDEGHGRTVQRFNKKKKKKKKKRERKKKKRNQENNTKRKSKTDKQLRPPPPNN